MTTPLQQRIEALVTNGLGYATNGYAPRFSEFQLVRSQLAMLAGWYPQYQNVGEHEIVKAALCDMELRTATTPEAQAKAFELHHQYLAVLRALGDGKLSSILYAYTGAAA